MVFGSGRERIQFNGRRFGRASARVSPEGAARFLPEIRHLLQEGIAEIRRSAEDRRAARCPGRPGPPSAQRQAARFIAPPGPPEDAEDLAMNQFEAILSGSAPTSLAGIWLKFPDDPAADYQRWLDLDARITTTEYRGATWRREIMASHPPGIIAVRVANPRPDRVPGAPGQPASACGSCRGSDTPHCESGGGWRDSFETIPAAIRACPESGALKIVGPDALTLHHNGCVNFRTYRRWMPISRARRASLDTVGEVLERSSAITGEDPGAVPPRRPKSGQDGRSAIRSSTFRSIQRGRSGCGAALQYGRCLLSPRAGRGAANLQGVWNDRCARLGQQMDGEHQHRR